MRPERGDDNWAAVALVAGIGNVLLSGLSKFRATNINGTKLKRGAHFRG
jgi:hypothetical protein